MGALLALVPTTTCLSRILLHLPCPACGLTRATLALLRLDLATATRMHPLALPLALLCGAMVVMAVSVEEPVWRRAVAVATGAAGVALLAVWVLRLCGMLGGMPP
jgi:hypothetical protein